jgi:hypothetical protein
MKQLAFFSLIATLVIALSSCEKTTIDTAKIDTPRSSSVPDELVGRWAIVSISGSTVYNIPSGSTHNTNEGFLGYDIKKNGTVQEDGYVATYQYGISTWAKWTAFGSVEVKNGGLSFHRAHGSYTSSRSSSKKQYGPDEVYPNKSVRYVKYEFGTDGRGNKALVLTNADGAVSKLVRQ